MPHVRDIEFASQSESYVASEIAYENDPDDISLTREVSGWSFLVIQRVYEMGFQGCYRWFDCEKVSWKVK